MTIYLDHAFRQNRATYACFRANGITGLARYYDGGRVQHKGLTLAEAQDIAAIGLRLHAVYETSGGADIEGFPQGGDYFTYDQGHRDWLEAVVDANSARQPKGTPVFLAVDRHLPPNDGRLRAYFQGATDADRGIGASGYAIGCYGPDYVCLFIRDTFGITHLWPWTPRPPAYPQLDYDLWQMENGQTLCGVSVDYNDCQLEGWITEGATHMTTPTFFAQSSDLVLGVGDVGQLVGEWTYGPLSPTGNTPRPKVRKVYALAPGRRVYWLYPDVDPDADPTEDLSAQPAVFVVDVHS